ncbi:Pyruvate dehydrogenase [NADP(+)], mitochondrial [Symbiodinium microadriaticum]|uniref:Pyruvate dehydrogenase [NADP(+)], mitochondrial n=1 Tax=Symbiodinium microadriaticum TaxID=2951 RepID=A0A1Q9CGA5_SYMMI|nr:Pyruvate dehydrogenase [NADP(+)], mitochondrial [Symbiodinium microadriaticum]
MLDQRQRRKTYALRPVREGGAFVVNCPWKTVEALLLHGGLPAKRINQVMQDAKEQLEGAIDRMYGKKSPEIVRSNKAALAAAPENLHKRSIDSRTADELAVALNAVSAFTPGGETPIGQCRANQGSKHQKRALAEEIPVWIPDKCTQCNLCSVVCPHAVVGWAAWKISPHDDGQEKWHALRVRPFLLDKKEMEAAPEGFQARKAKGGDLGGLNYSIQLAPYDCTGCAVCVEMCPDDALIMEPPSHSQQKFNDHWEYSLNQVSVKDNLMEKTSVKGSQLSCGRFQEPLIEFSHLAALRGLSVSTWKCMVIANSSGCSSVTGTSDMTIEAAAHAKKIDIGKTSGCLAWGFGLGADLGMLIDDVKELLEEALGIHEDLLRVAGDGTSQVREGADPWQGDHLYAEFLYPVWSFMKEAKAKPPAPRPVKPEPPTPVTPEMCWGTPDYTPEEWSEFLNQAAHAAYILALEEYNAALEATAAAEARKHWSKIEVFVIIIIIIIIVVIILIMIANTALQPQIVKLLAAEPEGDEDMLVAPSHWIIGGDGWAYDIGFGGLDHVLATGQNVNILVLDTEGYSNTGAQISKATPKGATMKMAAGGNKIKKKDLGAIAMMHENAYVASVSLSADVNQTVKVPSLKLPGPSIVIAYATCVDWGHRAGDKAMVMQQVNAVESGYWPLYRYNPEKVTTEFNGFELDNKRISSDAMDTLMRNECRGRHRNRFTSLQRTAPEHAKLLQDAMKDEFTSRHESRRRKAMGDEDLLEYLKKCMGEQVTGERVTVLYGTDTGNAEMVAKNFQFELKRRGMKAKCLSFNDVAISDLAEESKVLAVVATAGQGEMPKSAVKFWQEWSPDFFDNIEAPEKSFLELVMVRPATLCADPPNAYPKFEEELSPPSHLVEILPADDSKAKLASEPFVPHGSKPVAMTVKRSTVPDGYERAIDHFEFNLEGSGLSYDQGDSLGLWPKNSTAQDEEDVYCYQHNHDCYRYHRRSTTRLVASPLGIGWIELEEYTQHAVTSRSLRHWLIADGENQGTLKDSRI